MEHPARMTSYTQSHCDGQNLWSYIGNSVLVSWWNSLTYKQLRRTAAERDKVACAAWHHDLTTHFTAEQLIFIDESRKHDWTLYRHFGRVIEVVEFDRGDQWSILLALTLDSYIAVWAVIGSIDGVEFYHFAVNDVVSSTFSYCPINALYHYCSCWKWTLFHKSKSVCKAVEAAGRYNIIDALVILTAQSGCVLMFLPTYFPDLNPIEESFSAGMSSNWYFTLH